MAAQDNITAHPGGGQANATSLTGSRCRVATAQSGDSVGLPAATADLQLVLCNDTQASITVYPASGEKIDMLATNTPVVLIGNKTAIFSCVAAGKWHSHFSL